MLTDGQTVCNLENVTPLVLLPYYYTVCWFLPVGRKERKPANVDNGRYCYDDDFGMMSSSLFCLSLVEKRNDRRFPKSVLFQIASNLSLYLHHLIVAVNSSQVFSRHTKINHCILFGTLSFVPSRRYQYRKR